jgi:hypothetical protein
MATDSHSADTFFILRSAMELYQSEQIGKVNPVALRVLDSRAWSKSRILSNISGSISASDAELLHPAATDRCYRNESQG